MNVKCIIRTSKLRCSGAQWGQECEQWLWKFKQLATKFCRQLLIFRQSVAICGQNLRLDRSRWSVEEAIQLQRMPPKTPPKMPLRVNFEKETRGKFFRHNFVKLFQNWPIWFQSPIYFICCPFRTACLGGQTGPLLH